MAAVHMSAPAEASIGPHAELDKEIAKIRSQIQSLRRHRKELANSFLATTSGQSLLNRVRPGASTSFPSDTAETSPLAATAETISSKLSRRAQESNYRLGAGCTTFSVRDPDPNAVDGGRVLGVRIEVLVQNKFQTPYYILLNRPYAENQSILHIHKHTIPLCIPLRSLASRYLPQPAVAALAAKARKQDLPGLVRALRREIVSLHMREMALVRVRKELGLPEEPAGSEERPEGGVARYGVQEISFTDGEKLDLRIQWSTGSIGRLRMSKGGKIEKCVIFGLEGRDRPMERHIVQDGGIDMEELWDRLKAMPSSPAA